MAKRANPSITFDLERHSSIAFTRICSDAGIKDADVECAYILAEKFSHVSEKNFDEAFNWLVRRVKQN